MSYQNLLVSRENKIETITVNRPEKLNALNRATIIELSQALNAANSDNDVQVVILTGAGTKAFVAGADIVEFASYSSKEGEELSRNGHQSLFDLAENLSKPVIAAVNGFALGGGLELAMSCHIRVASDNARMDLSEARTGSERLTVIQEPELSRFSCGECTMYRMPAGAGDRLSG